MSASEWQPIETSVGPIKPWTAEHILRRPALIRYRRGNGFEVQPEFEAGDGKLVHLRYPHIMPEDGHSLYAEQVCWDVCEYDEGLPGYVCEGDFEWVTNPAAE